MCSTRFSPPTAQRKALLPARRRCPCPTSKPPPSAPSLWSAEAFATKPGYDGVVEAICNGVPVPYVRHGDWPEEPGLIAWPSAAVPAAEIGRESLGADALVGPLEDLLVRTWPDPSAPSGIGEAAALLAPRLEF